MSSPKVPLNPVAQEWSPSPPLPHIMFGKFRVILPPPPVILNFPYNDPQPLHVYYCHPTPPPPPNVYYRHPTPQQNVYYRHPTPPPPQNALRRRPIPPRMRRQAVGPRNPPRPTTTKENYVWMKKEAKAPPKIYEHRRGAASTSKTVISSTNNSLTTVMIRNIPNRLRDHTLEYDFLYLPMDFKRNNNLGFAFVNFTTAKAANVFKSVLKNYEWKAVEPMSRKICDITWARVQGKEGLINRFKNSIFTCDSREFLPVILDPPRNGWNSKVAEPWTVGEFLKSG